MKEKTFYEACTVLIILFTGFFTYKILDWFDYNSIVIALAPFWVLALYGVVFFVSSVVIAFVLYVFGYNVNEKHEVE